MIKLIRPLLAALALLAGVVLVAPAAHAEPAPQMAPVQVAQKAPCNYCLIIYNDETNLGFYVTEDNPLSCNASVWRWLGPKQNSRTHADFIDAACFEITVSYDALVYDPQAYTSTWVCATGMKRLAEPPYPSGAYKKRITLWPNNALHC